MKGPSLFVTDHRTVSGVSGPLLFLDEVQGVGAGELVEVIGPDGRSRDGQVLELDGARAVIQVFQGTRGLDLETTTVRTHGQAVRLGVGTELLGRVLDAFGRPLDGGPPPLPSTFRDVHGGAVNPMARRHPQDFVQTGFSVIDGLNTLVRGQKLPIFSGFGLPASEIAAQIAAQAEVPGESEGFAVVFAAMGITWREASFFRASFERQGALPHSILFLNHADDPTVERLLLPRAALTAAEHLAFDHGKHVLVILTDMTRYCEALREVSAAREEVPGRRGFPGYLYTDLASIYERAGRRAGSEGSVTQLLVLSMPDDDITHPIPDLTGYITEGQVVLSRELHRRGIFPPVDVLPSLSRLMNSGIGAGRTREDHRRLADQLYALYARGRDARRLAAVIGQTALPAEDQKALTFAEAFEQTFVDQGPTARTLEQTLDAAWDLLKPFEPRELKRLTPELIERYRPS